MEGRKEGSGGGGGGRRESMQQKTRRKRGLWGEKGQHRENLKEKVGGKGKRKGRTVGG